MLTDNLNCANKDDCSLDKPDIIYAQTGKTRKQGVRFFISVWQGFARPDRMILKGEQK